MNFRYSFLLLCAAVASVLSPNAQQNAPFMFSPPFLSPLSPLHHNYPHILSYIFHYSTYL